MQLNHLDLHVPNVIESREFFINFLDFKLMSAPSSSAIAILEDESEFVLVLQKQKHPDDHYPEGFHIGFYVQEQTEVDERHQRLASSGFKVSKIEQNNRGYFFYVQAPGGFLVEINARLS